MRLADMSDAFKCGVYQSRTLEMHANWLSTV
jgi:hypothetical protein